MAVRLIATLGEAVEIEPAQARHIPFVRNMAADGALPSRISAS